MNSNLEIDELDALEKLDPEWERAVRDLYRTGWRQ